MKVAVTKSVFDGAVSAVPSKSQAHRLLIAAGLKKGSTAVRNVGRSDDVLATCACLEALGATIENKNGDAFVRGITSVKKGGVLPAGESGSTLRFLLPVAAALGAECSFSGKGRLLSRPVASLTEALQDNGVETDGIVVRGKARAGRYVIDATVSSQYITGLLFALPLLDGDSTLEPVGEAVSKKYVEMTEEVLKKANIETQTVDIGYYIRGNQQYNLPDEVVCEGDWSSAAFMLVAGAVGRRVAVSGLNTCSLQGDSAILGILRQTGATVCEEGNAVEVIGGAEKPFDVDIENIPDLAPVLAVLAATLKGESVLRNVGRLRITESDRLQAIEEMLTVAGIGWQEKDNTLVIWGGIPHGGDFDGKNDHRMVMASCLLASLCDQRSTVSYAEAVNKSYPSFYEDLTKIGGNFYVEMDG